MCLAASVAHLHFVRVSDFFFFKHYAKLKLSRVASQQAWQDTHVDNKKEHVSPSSLDRKASRQLAVVFLTRVSKFFMACASELLNQLVSRLFSCLVSQLAERKWRKISSISGVLFIYDDRCFLLSFPSQHPQLFAAGWVIEWDFNLSDTSNISNACSLIYLLTFILARKRSSFILVLLCRSI